MKQLIILLLTLSIFSHSQADTNITSGKTQKYTLLAWNDLGMHCFDGSDFSVFSILPPYNTINAHLIKNEGDKKKHIKENVTLTYEALAYDGHINTTSSNKTNFWEYLPALFPGFKSVPEVGLTGNKTPSKTPNPMNYNAKHNWWEAEGVPIVNRDDSGRVNHYPMVRIVAKDTKGTFLASADIVLPVSDEMDCAKCHSSKSISSDAKPKSGWVNHANDSKDYKLNILKLHDAEHPINPADLEAVKAKGFNYQASLYQTALAGTPILCASCHTSNALGTKGIGKATSLSSALHLTHAKVFDKYNAQDNRNSCYSCHPGNGTECLRGAMGSVKDDDGQYVMDCQSCHGTLHDVGNPNRKGWLDEPNCQVCHQDTKRHESAIVNGTLREVIDHQFATNPNTPTKDVSLYRYSTGHGDLQCSSCHGSTHAIFPSILPQDNIHSEKVQGHSGTIAECSACHTTMPKTTKDGPHGIHSLGQEWVDNHKIPEDPYYESCEKCHGYEYKGTFLSKAFSKRSFKVDKKIVTYEKGQVIGCYDCHGKKWKYK